MTLKAKAQNLGLGAKEITQLLGLDRKLTKEVKKWIEDESLIPKAIKSKVDKLVSKPPYQNHRSKFKFIDLFAGIGGLRLGFQLEGGDCVFTSEWDKYAQLTYRANFGDEPQGDITKINENEIPDHDILLGGFPCQSFSHAGKKLGFEDTRGTLFFDVARIINKKRPHAFLLENVKGLVSHEKGNTFKTILEVLNNLDYQVFFKVLNSRDFGVPQNRQRIIIVGFNRKSFPNGFDFEKNFSFPEASDKKVKVGQVLEQGKVDPKYTLSDKLWTGHQNRRLMHAEKGNGFGYSLFNSESPYTNTISARYYKDGSEALVDQSQFKLNPRKLTPRECARLQGFPEDYILPCSDNQAYKQFGNSVTVPLMNAVAKEILKTLKKKS